MSDLQKLKEVITLTAAYYGFNLRPEVLLMYVEDLSDFPEFEVISAYQAYRKNPKNRTMPLPAQIIGVLSPELTTDGKANEVASRIRSAIGKFGWPNPGDARDYIGELGWKIVERNGGWQTLCENHGVDLNPLTFFAQSRDQAKFLIESASIGEFDKPIGIEFKAEKHPDMLLSDKKNEQVTKLLNHLKTNEMPK
ncbi:MAG: hypothetical protein BWZ03_00649 [bacterium ADurb.BinA186]|nr:MAG: hypothetical protein BWZ03_00649 [bacterium ADurb.BinA186]